MTNVRAHPLLKTILTFFALNIPAARPSFAQEVGLCAVLAKAEGTNTVVRVTTVSGDQRVGRVSLVRCPEHVKLGVDGILAAEISRVEVRRTGHDSVLNGMAIGSLVTGTLAAVALGLLSGSDSVGPTFVAFGAGGALIGLMVDIAHEPELEWQVSWRRSE
jgi:hypothetical protein